jgi:hypothetical protein
MRRRRESLVLIALPLLGLPGLGACAVEAGDAAPGGADTNEAGQSEGETGQPEAELTPARGISILEVEINQGTRIPVGVGGDWVGPEDRLGYLIASRDSLMRVHYTVEEGWVPREIEARLTLNFPDGTSTELSDTRLVEYDSSPKNFNGPFRFGLVADAGQTIAGTEYHLELWEAGAGAGADMPEGEWQNPAVGSRLIGFEAVPMQIKSLLVPITYQGGTANLDEETTNTVQDNLYEQNPATEILYDVHPPLPYDGQLNNLGDLLPVMASLRTQEGAEPNVYYHALVDIGSQSLGGVLGISYVANDTKGDAASRVSATVLWTPDPTIAADTYTHETGHAQGLQHIECPNADSASPDPAYPYANGRIGNWGFGIRRFLMYDPDDAYDYMSYCSPSWVSDWTWNKVYRRIKTLTSWDFGAPAADAEPLQELLVGAIYPDGREQWWTMPGTIDPDRVTGLDRFEFETAEGEIIETYADVALLSDDQTYWIKAALPEGRAPEQFGAIRHVRGGEVRTITPEAIGLPIDVSAIEPYQPQWKVLRR